VLDARGGLGVSELPIVRDYMDKRVPSVGPDTEILDAIEFLLRHRVTGAPVVDDAGYLIGMLTEKDCLKLIATGIGGDAPRGRVADFMTTEVETISPDMDVYYVAGLFLNYQFRRFPVVEDGRLVGAITRFDILRVMRAYMRRPRRVPDRAARGGGTG
jgi:CBS domain-containing protein